MPEGLDSDCLKKKDNTKLSFKIKSIYGMGSLANCVMSSILFTLAMPIYNIGLGVSPVLVGMALSVPRFWDAVIDPFMGNLSDNTRTRWGRRRPYIFIGAVLTGICCAAIWRPPAFLNETGLFIYLLVTSIIFFTTFTVFTVPYAALGMELTTDYDERTSVMAYKTFFQSMSAALIMPFAYKLCFYSGFGSNEVEGVRTVGLLFGGFIIITGILPAIFTKENAVVQRQSKIKLISAVRYTLKDKPFMMLSAATFLIILGLFIILPLQSYMCIFYVFNGNRDAAATVLAGHGVAYGVMAMVSVPIITWLSKKWGKKGTLMVGLVLISFLFLSSWFLFTPKHPYLQILFSALRAPEMCFIWILTSSMIADVCDIDELATGLRREGMFGAIFSWVFKLALAFAMLVSGWIVKFSGLDTSLDGPQTLDTINKLRINFAIIPGLFMVAAFIFLMLYPISKKRILEVRAILNERKAESNKSDI
ncbi:MAG: MFS transporter [Sedimentisphaeraceae bacterium JB056]